MAILVDIMLEVQPKYLLLNAPESNKITSLPGFSDLNAVKKNNVYILEPFYARASDRTLEFLRALREIYTTNNISGRYGIKL